MKNNLKTPCAECPFRKNSAPGWLGGETVQDTFQHVSGEGDFACHMTRQKKRAQMSRCRGSLLFMKKSGKRPQYNDGLVRIFRELGQPDTSNILSVPEFFNHHSVAKKKVKDLH